MFCHVLPADTGTREVRRLGREEPPAPQTLQTQASCSGLTLPAPFHPWLVLERGQQLHPVASCPSLGKLQYPHSSHPWTPSLSSEKYLSRLSRLGAGGRLGQQAPVSHFWQQHLCSPARGQGSQEHCTDLHSPAEGAHGADSVSPAPRISSKPGPPLPPRHASLPLQPSQPVMMSL